MAGDYTRWTFDPTKDYKSVFKQQGRVDLDADWNELVEITDRRWRTESMDIAGQDFVSEVTPDAFLITPAGPNDFSIGIGRLYVDGLVAECHGCPPPAKFDPILGETQWQNPVLYSNQPYLPKPLPPTIASGATGLIYLDVWEREVTAIQDPNIREKALAGPDTCTRLQTVWQVRNLPVDRAYACGDDIPAWDNLIAPSAGRLTTSTLAPNPGATPCILSQTGGYTGLENRLYRVEVHVGGTLDGANGTTQALFKWSRDNGSVVAAVTGISTSGGSSLLNVSTLGRDAVLRFNVGDWVEVLDDYTEFEGIAGHMAKIQSTAPAGPTLTVSPAVPTTFNFNPGDPSRHTRIRRWDGRADVNSDVNPASGLIPVGAGQIDIEQGIQVSFSVAAANGSFNVGDYWIFAARTFDASVEPLAIAPPRGILHHYCRLGFITWDGNGKGTPTDCRPKHECECGGGCTVTVGDGVNSFGQFTDIKKAIDSLGLAGGVVCVGRGVFVVTQTISITRESGPVTLIGMGNATRIIYRPAESKSGVLLQISQTDHIRVEGFFMAAVSASALIEIDSCSFCSVRECTLVNLGIAAARGFAMAKPAPGGAVEPSSSAIVLTDTGNGPCIECEIKENAILAAKGLLGSTVQDLSVRDNDFLCFHCAIFLDSANGLQVHCNLIRGLSQIILEELQRIVNANDLTANITAFQNAVTSAFATSSGSQFMGTGMVLISGFKVDVSHNRIAAQVAILTILLVEASFDCNEILALVGFFSLFAIMVRVANSLIAGLLIGYAQMGLVIDFVCEANLWLGFAGIIFLPLSEFLVQIAPTVGTGLSQAKIVADPATTFTSVQQTGETSVGALRSFGLAATIKIHRNEFATFLYGIAKFGSFLSVDFSIIDNTFSLCSEAAIFLSPQLGDLGSLVLQKTSVFASAVNSFFNLRHLIQANSMVISGTGINTSCPQTQIRDNSIKCSLTAVDLGAISCDVLNNTLVGNPTLASASTGLLQVQYAAHAACIRGNRISDGPCNGILLVSDANYVKIEDNTIGVFGQNGITSVDNLGSFLQLSISRNTILGSAGGIAGSIFWHAGAIILPELTDVRIAENTISGNLTSAATIGSHAIYIDDCTGADLSQNLITGNFVTAPAAGAATGGIHVSISMGELLLHGNRVRGNGGRAIHLFNMDAAGIASVQHNYVDNIAAANSNSDRYLVYATGQSFLHFEDNICRFAFPEKYTYARAVFLATRSGRILVNGNSIQMIPAQKGRPWALEVDAPERAAIVTSNFLTNGPGFIYTGAPLQANNLDGI